MKMPTPVKNGDFLLMPAGVEYVSIRWVAEDQIQQGWRNGFKKFNSKEQQISAATE